MGIRQGYKQSEVVGVIPKDWDVKPISEICLKIQDGNYGADYPKSSEFVKFGIPFLTSKAIGKDGTLKEHLIDYISESKHAELKKAQLSLNDILFTNRGASVGAIGFVSHNICNGNIGPQLTLLRGNQEFISSDFLYHVMKSEIFQKQIFGQDSGSAMNFFSIGATKRFLIPFPKKKSEQRAIATALSDVDALLTKLDALIVKKRDLKQATMQRLLTGQTRLQGFAGEWDVKSFGEIFDYLSTATNSRSDLSDSGDTYYIHYGDIHMRFHSQLNFSAELPPMIFRQRCRNAALLKNGDWVMADASEDYDGVGKAIEITGLKNGVQAIAGLHTFLLREKTPVFASGFKGHLGNLHSLHQQYLRVATGMKVFGVSKTALKDLTLCIPPIEEQAVIATLLSDMDAEIDTFEVRRDKTRTIKQGMMQELLTGRIRLI